MWWDCLLPNVQCYSHTVVHGKRCDETAFHKVCHVTYILFSHRKRRDETTIHKMCNLTHLLLVIVWKDMMRLPFTKCLTHLLWGIGKDVVRLPFTECVISLTNWWSEEKMWWDCLSQNVQCRSHTVGHRKRCDETAFHKMCNLTHILFSHRKRCDETTIHKMCNLTHLLLIIAWKDMTLLFTKCAILLTCCGA